jgi:5-methylcytosine-specific restriction endonuclease McrA
MSRCLVLNAGYEYLSIAERWIDALGLVLSRKATPIEEYAEVVRSQREVFRLPAVVVMNRHVKSRRKVRLWVTPTRRLVFSRDGFRCQYCGIGISMKTGTRDHVLPLSRGGPDVLSNVVAACRDCNGRKDARTPEEAGMRLLSQPRSLTESEKIQCLLKTCRTKERDTWLECLDRIGARLG